MQIVEEWGCEYNLEIYLCQLRNWVVGSLEIQSCNFIQNCESQDISRAYRGWASYWSEKIVWNKFWERAVGRQIAGIGTKETMQTDCTFNTFA